jgi:hypothetical protein
MIVFGKKNKTNEKNKFMKNETKQKEKHENEKK